MKLHEVEPGGEAPRVERRAVAAPGNLLVIGPGEYDARDFARIGIIIQVIVLFATLLVVPVLFPF